MWEEFKFAVNFRYWVLQKIVVFILCLFHFKINNKYVINKYKVVIQSKWSQLWSNKEPFQSSFSKASQYLEDWNQHGIERK